MASRNIVIKTIQIVLNQLCSSLWTSRSWYIEHTKYGRFTDTSSANLVWLFSDHLTTITWWHCLSACYKLQHQKSIKKKQRKQRKNGQIKVDIIFLVFGEGGGLWGERVIFITIKKSHQLTIAIGQIHV